jgi:hypothetical protein
MIEYSPGERRVSVWGKPHEITVYRKSKSVWVAVGDYMGEMLRTEGPSANAAVTDWRDGAERKGKKAKR